MRGSIYPNLYRLAVGERFGISALLFPLQQLLKLGDYGLFRHGAFVRVGNIFLDGALKLEDHLDKRVSDPLPDLLIHTVNGQRRFAPYPGDSAAHDVRLQLIEFPHGHGMVVHFQKRSSELLQLDQEIAQYIRSLIAQDRWDPSYRLVWQRDIAERWYAAYTYSAGGTVALYPLNHSPHLQPEHQTLELLPSHCDNINGDFWWHKTFPISPAVNFVRFCKREADFCCQERHDGIDAFMDLGAADPFFLLDNS